MSVEQKLVFPSQLQSKTDDVIARFVLESRNLSIATRKIVRTRSSQLGEELITQCLFSNFGEFFNFDGKGLATD